ncbi:MAG: YqjD family protein [Marinobacter sp.]
MEAKSGQNDYEQVREDVQKLREDLAKLTKSVADGQKNNISHLRDEIRRESREAFDQVKQRGDEAFNRARDAGTKAVDDVEHRIEERPFLSIVIMFLAGLLVGRFLDR